MEWHDRNIPREKKFICRALQALGEKNFRRLLEIKRADNLAQAPAYRDRQREIDLAEEILDELLAEYACFSLRQLAVNGKDFTEMGLSGPAVGAALEALLDRVVEGELPNDRETLLAYARNFTAPDIPGD